MILFAIDVLQHKEVYKFILSSDKILIYYNINYIFILSSDKTIYFF